MSELDRCVQSLHKIRTEKRSILKQEAVLREEIIRLAGKNAHHPLGELTLNVSIRSSLKIVNSHLVPAFLCSQLPDQDRINQYFDETGQVPNGVEISESTYVKVEGPPAKSDCHQSDGFFKRVTNVLRTNSRGNIDSSNESDTKCCVCGGEPDHEVSEDDFWIDSEDVYFQHDPEFLDGSDSYLLCEDCYQRELREMEYWARVAEHERG